MVGVYTSSSISLNPSTSKGISTSPATMSMADEVDGTGSGGDGGGGEVAFLFLGARFVCNQRLNWLIFGHGYFCKLVLI